jgi:hypothetical protein
MGRKLLLDQKLFVYGICNYKFALKEKNRKAKRENLEVVFSHVIILL